MNKNQPIVVTKKLTKSFGEITAVRDLSLTINTGEVFGLLGPNGAGKTTTVRLLAALLAPTAGEAQIAGFQVSSEGQHIRRIIGLLPEAPGLYDGLSAEQNLAFYGDMYGIEDKPKRIQRYLDLLGLWHRRYEPVGTFSKGMRQKLAIARALLHEPKVLFLDEPTSGLDPQASRLVRDFIAELRQQGRTIIICTHNLEEADRLCDRVAVLSGHLLALDSPSELRRKLFGRQVVFHLDEASLGLAAGLEGLPGVSKVEVIDNKILASVENPEIHNPELVRYLVENGAEIQFVGELRRRLEDVYLELMGKAEGQGNEKN
jgi:ABC-2 type transport system ATP-binding protein